MLQFIFTAVAAKMAMLKTKAFFRQRAQLANVAQFDALLSAVPAVPPLAGDAL
jgi:hypothetical protein